MISPDQLRDRTKRFALRILKLFRSLPHTAEAQVIGRQLIHETIYWLELLADDNIVAPALLKDLSAEAHELTAIFTAARTTTKSS